MLLFKVQNHKGMLNCCNSKRQHSHWESNLNTVRERGKGGGSPSAAKDVELFLQHLLIQQIKEFFSATANSSTLAWIWNDKGEALMKCLPQPMINLATDCSPPVRVKKRKKSEWDATNKKTENPLSCLLNHNWEQFFGVQNMHSAVSTALPWNGVSCSMRRNLVSCKQSEKPHAYLSVAKTASAASNFLNIYIESVQELIRVAEKNIYLKIDQQLFNFLQWIS